LIQFSVQKNGHRRYTEADFERVGFIQSLKATGTTLREICHFIDLFRQGDSTLEIRRQLLEAQRKKVRQHIAELREAEAFIDRKIVTYYGLADMVNVHEREEHVYITT
jgi:DNA-binding transcriptional MerR regulator